jgi:hypothetical protein
MVVSLSCAGSISPRPLKRLISTLPRPVNSVSRQLNPVRVVAGIERLAALGELVERRDGEIEVPLADQFGHLLVEEGDQQRRDMRAVDIGIGHDDDAIVAQIFLAVL